MGGGARTRADDLQLADLRHRLPLLHGSASRCDVGKGRAGLERANVAREVEPLVAVLDGELVARRHAPAGERRHRHAAVLQLRRAEPSERCLRAEVRKAERIPDRVASLLGGALPVHAQTETGSSHSCRAPGRGRLVLACKRAGGNRARHEDGEIEGGSWLGSALDLRWWRGDTHMPSAADIVGITTREETGARAALKAKGDDSILRAILRQRARSSSRLIN